MMLSYSRNGKTYETEANNLSALSLAYLMQYGWAQSLQDCIAGREKKVKEEFLDTLRAKAIEANPAGNMNAAEYEAFIDDAVLESLDDVTVREAQSQDLDGQLSKRMDAILKGTIGTRGTGESRDPLRAVAADMVRKKAKATGVKFDKEELADKVTAILANPAQRAKVEAEYARRQTADVDVDI